MKKKYIVILLSIFTILCILYINRSSVNYTLSKDIVTYFDNDGRYQLIKVTKTDYFIIDAKKNIPIVNFVLYYAKTDNNIYTISKENQLQTIYSIIDLKNNKIKMTESIQDFNDQIQNIFLDTSNWTDLTTKRTSFEKWYVKIIPPKWRKW